jgi:hypothetical protein
MRIRLTTAKSYVYIIFAWGGEPALRRRTETGKALRLPHTFFRRRWLLVLYCQTNHNGRCLEA